MTKLVLHLVRHGRSEWNAAGRIQGHSNSDLDEVGRQQAQRVGRALARRPLKALYASDLTRAQQTAAGIREATGLDIQTDIRLRETNFGVLEGLTWEEAKQHQPEAYAAYMGRNYRYVVPNGESRWQTLERALEAFEALADRHPDQEIAVVSHGGLISFFLRYVIGIPYDAEHRFKTANASISTFDRKELGWRLLTWGATSHLDELDDA